MTDSEIIKNALAKAYKNGYRDDLITERSYFTKEFAKAFWKDEEDKIVKVTNTDRSSVEQLYCGWEYWLSQFVLADDPYEFLARFLVVKGGE